MEFQHKSVLLSQCLEALAVKPDGIYLDGTLGGAGHSSQIAKRLTQAASLGWTGMRLHFAQPGSGLRLTWTA